MIPGKLWPDADGRHPYAHASWIGQARWTTLSAQVAIGPSARQPDLAALVLSVPAALHHGFGMRLAHCLAGWRRWRDSGFGLVTLRTPGHRVFAVLDVAGQQDVELLKHAASDGDLYAMPIAAELEKVTPLVPIYGVRDMLVEAQAARRLSASELAEAITDLRADLRQPNSFAELSGFEQAVDSVTVNVCVR